VFWQTSGLPAADLYLNIQKIWEQTENMEYTERCFVYFISLLEKTQAIGQLSLFALL